MSKLKNVYDAVLEINDRDVPAQFASQIRSVQIKKGVLGMQRYFVGSHQINDHEVIITGSDVHHIANVMRANAGDEFLVCTDAALTFLVRITAISQSEVKMAMVEQKKENVELPIAVTIAQGIAKGDKFDLVVQKGTECGASAFIPLAMKRSVAKIEDKKAGKKIERWQKIALEGARQAHRQVVPKIYEPLSLSELIKQNDKFDVCLFAYELHDEFSKTTLAKVAKNLIKGQKVLVIIGPEGGIDDQEAEFLIEAGFVAIGLGPRILRTETAPIYLLSAMSYALEIAK